MTEATPSMGLSTAVFRTDPYAAYHQLRSAQPVLASSQFDHLTMRGLAELRVAVFDGRVDRAAGG